MSSMTSTMYFSMDVDKSQSKKVGGRPPAPIRVVFDALSCKDPTKEGEEKERVGNILRCKCKHCRKEVKPELYYLEKHGKECDNMDNATRGFVLSWFKSQRNKKAAVKAAKKTTFYAHPHDLGIPTIVNNISNSCVGMGLGGGENTESYGLNINRGGSVGVQMGFAGSRSMRGGGSNNGAMANYGSSSGGGNVLHSRGFNRRDNDVNLSRVPDSGNDAHHGVFPGDTISGNYGGFPGGTISGNYGGFPSGTISANHGGFPGDTISANHGIFLGGAMDANHGRFPGGAIDANFGGLTGGRNDANFGGFTGGGNDANLGGFTDGGIDANFGGLTGGSNMANGFMECKEYPTNNQSIMPKLESLSTEGYGLLTEVWDAAFRLHTFNNINFNMQNVDGHWERLFDLLFKYFKVVGCKPKLPSPKQLAGKLLIENLSMTNSRIIKLAKDVGVVGILMDESTKQRIGRLIIMMVIKGITFVIKIHHQKAGDKTAARMFAIYKDTVSPIIASGVTVRNANTDNCAAMTKLRRDIGDTYEETIPGGCFSHVTSNTSNTVEQHGHFEDVVYCVKKIINNIFNTEAYGVLRDILGIHCNKFLGKPVPQTNLVWNGLFLQCQWIIKHKDAVCSMMIDERTKKYFDKKASALLLRDDQIWDKMALFDKFGSKFIENKKFLLRDRSFASDALYVIVSTEKFLDYSVVKQKYFDAMNTDNSLPPELKLDEEDAKLEEMEIEKITDPKKNPFAFRYIALFSSVDFNNAGWYTIDIDDDKATQVPEAPFESVCDDASDKLKKHVAMSYFPQISVATLLDPRYREFKMPPKYVSDAHQCIRDHFGDDTDKIMDHILILTQTLYDVSIITQTLCATSIITQTLCAGSILTQTLCIGSSLTQTQCIGSLLTQTLCIGPTEYLSKCGVWGTGPFDHSEEMKNMYRFSWHYNSPKPWRLLRGIDNKLISYLCDYAGEALNYPIDISQLEKFYRNYRDIQAHHRNTIGPVTQDNIISYKYNTKQLRKFGFE